MFGTRKPWAGWGTAGLILALGGCFSSPYARVANWEQPYDKAWDTAVAVLSVDYAWYRIDKRSGELETEWQGASGPFRHEGARKKIVARLSREKNGKVKMEIGVESERPESYDAASDPPRVSWEAEKQDDTEAARLLHLMEMRLVEFGPSPDLEKKIRAGAAIP